MCKDTQDCKDGKLIVLLIWKPQRNHNEQCIDKNHDRKQNWLIYKVQVHTRVLIAFYGRLILEVSFEVFLTGASLI